MENENEIMQSIYKYITILSAELKEIKIERDNVSIYF